MSDKVGTKRVVQITKIEDVDQLVKYAVIAHIERLARAGVKQYEIAQSIGADPGNFSNDLKSEKLPDSLLKKLDKAFNALDFNAGRSWGLAGLAVRLRRMDHGEELTLQVPLSWASEALVAPALDEFGVLMQGAIFRGIFETTPTRASAICQQSSGRFNEVVDRLILIGASPPTPRNVDALLLLGRIAGYAFEEVKDHLRAALKDPLGFRVWRAITTLTTIEKDNEEKVRDGTAPPNTSFNTALQYWLVDLLHDLKDLRKCSLYPARSLDLEVAIGIPSAWLDEKDLVEDLLWDRARDPAATVRERATAACGLWERVFTYAPADRDTVKVELMKLIQNFYAEADTDVGVLRGLRWAADCLTQVLGQDVMVCNEWPDSEDPCLGVVREAARALSEPAVEAVPARLLPATRTLLEHAVLQNAGVLRRQALDTIVAGGWAPAVARALQVVLRHKKSEDWLLCRALFAMSFLQVRDTLVIQELKSAYRKQYSRLDNVVTRSGAAVMHAALFALGDCFGTSFYDASADTMNMRAQIEPTLRIMLERSREEALLHTVSRAAAYLITVTARADVDGSYEMLSNLKDHKDETTRTIAQWAVSTRFLINGRKERYVRPLHEVILPMDDSRRNAAQRDKTR